MTQQRWISKYTPAFILDAIGQYYGMTISDIEVLQSYDDLNFRITVADTSYLVKLSVQSSQGFIQTQNKLLDHLTSLDIVVPQCINTHSGDRYVSLEEGNLILRVMTFLEGDFLSKEISSLSPSLVGTFHGQLDQACSTFSDLRFNSDRGIWNLEYASQLKSYLQYIDDAYLRTLIYYFIQQFELQVLSTSSTMSSGLIHNDFNHDNVLFVSENKLGIIDFGDMVFGPFAFNLAIGLTYYLLDSDNIIDDATKYTQAYREQHPISDQDIQNLYYIIAARICTSICSSSYKIKTGQSSAYISKDQAKMIAALNKLHTINPILFTNSVLGLDKHSNSVLGLDKHSNLYTSAQELLTIRQDNFSNAMSLSYHTPIHMSHGCMQYMYAKDGSTYLDGINNIMHLGHNNPYITHVTTIQSSQLNTNTRYLYDGLYSYTQKLLSKFPDKLNKLFLVNSGSAATDLALRIAHAYTQNNETVVMDHAYHGNTISAIDISPYKFNGKGGSGKQSNIHVLRIPNQHDPTISVESEISRLQKRISGRPTTIILESILGCGGQLALPDVYVKQLCETVQSNGGLYIADEVQVGFGRVGSHFWGYQMYDVSPDIVILGKPIGNGHPMGAVVCTQEVSDRFESGMEFFSSFGGNPVSCAIGEEVLDIIDKDNLQSRASKIGSYLYDQWEKLVQDFSCVGEVRGAGLFLGLEIIDIHHGGPDAQLATRIVNLLKDKYHILLSTDGPYHNIIKFKPSLYFTKENADSLYLAFREVLS